MITHTILIVEDEPGLLDLLSFHVQRGGFTVAQARDGLEALRMLEEIHPHAVVLDLNLPHVTGFRILELIKRGANPIPVIAVTALSFEEAEEVARKGADAFMTKPVDFDELNRLLHQILGSAP